MNRKIFIAFVIGLFGMTSVAFAQTTDASIKPVYKTGDVESIAADKVVIKTNGGSLEIVLNDKSEFKRISAEKPSLSSAAAVTISEISIGDKATISCLATSDGKSLWGRTVYFMTKADIAAKNAREAEAWRIRGITGKVQSVNTQTNQIVIETRTLMGSSNVTLTPKGNAKFLRYAPDSVRFDEAVASSLVDTKVGDMLRALGDRSSDGTSFAAEQVITGAFQTIAGTVKSIDVDKNEVLITDLQTKKDVVVVVGDQSILKRFPVEQAEQLVRFQMMAAGGGMGARPVGGGARPQGGAPAGGQPSGTGQPGGAGRPVTGGARGAGPGGVDDIFERLPAISAAELKAGDMIAISSTKNGVNTRIKAIKLIAGVEPFIRMAQAGGQGGRRGMPGGVDGGFSIPGLDP